MLSELFVSSKFYKSLPFYAFTPPVGVKMVYESACFRFLLWLKFENLLHGTLRLGEGCVGVDIHRDPGIRVSHQVLQTLQIHACVGHVRTEGVP